MSEQEMGKRDLMKVRDISKDNMKEGLDPAIVLGIAKYVLTIVYS